MDIKPVCFSSPRVWALWLAARKSCDLREREVPHCTDCLPSYQLRMKKLGRCANPGAMFTFDDGAVTLA